MHWAADRGPDKRATLDIAPPLAVQPTRIRVGPETHWSSRPFRSAKGLPITRAPSKPPSPPPPVRQATFSIVTPSVVTFAMCRLASGTSDGVGGPGGGGAVVVGRPVAGVRGVGGSATMPSSAGSGSAAGGSGSGSDESALAGGANGSGPGVASSGATGTAEESVETTDRAGFGTEPQPITKAKSADAKSVRCVIVDHPMQNDGRDDARGGPAGEPAEFVVWGGPAESHGTRSARCVVFCPTRCGRAMSTRFVAPRPGIRG